MPSPKPVEQRCIIAVLKCCQILPCTLDASGPYLIRILANNNPIGDSYTSTNGKESDGSLETCGVG